MKTIVAFLLLSFTCSGLTAQDVIRLKNPGFESEPEFGVVPEHWINLGSTSETPPDIQPGFFGVVDKPYEGKTYLGLVVR
ncbi:MAG TPA: OmpA family protein, partial [Saprospirales bacterium]|nr:OmpA family protein [Saprospirales bacterium]